VLRRAQSSFDVSIKEHLVAREIERRRIEALPGELARARMVFCSDMRLSNEQELVEWLRVRGMNEKELEDELRRIIAFGKLKEEVAGAHVERWFEEHRREYDSAVISRILTGDLAAGVRIKAELDAGAPFEEVALKDSTDPKTRWIGGYVGRVRRRDLSPSEADFVFAAPVPSISPPIAVKNAAMILRVERVFSAQLDQPTRAEIHERLFSAWLEAERARSKIELTLLEGVV
jgi:parvulin-like peptidyl-prolyl isomerase